MVEKSLCSLALIVVVVWFGVEMIITMVRVIGYDEAKGNPPTVALAHKLMTRPTTAIESECICS